MTPSERNYSYLEEERGTLHATQENSSGDLEHNFDPACLETSLQENHPKTPTLNESEVKSLLHPHSGSGPPSNAEQEKHMPHASFKWQDRWLWELICMLIGLASLGTNMTLLSFINGKARSWWTFPIKPNGVLSVFGTITKAAFMSSVTGCIGQLKWLHFANGSHQLFHHQLFDNASRGPVGSLVFLLSLRKMQAAWVTSLACLITIAALAVNPFMQEILSYPTRSVVTGTPAWTTAANAYDNGHWTITGGFDPELTDDLMQGAIISAIFSLSNQTSHLLNCPEVAPTNPSAGTKPQEHVTTPCR
ncbi:hypothetical protein O181_064204 [Austropuccinia psidii MF-1]|uniref:Uncharacterized protein n=1 Tax=Austropuccinia psidii MF-1 TaxID=1389203 RepID=A0A9Q3ENL6_9BASI|nr:hypothetical protein [Austropuccinia psidii MF-1]